MSRAPHDRERGRSGAFAAAGHDGVAELLSQDRLTFDADGIYNCEVDTDAIATDETGGRSNN